MMNKTKHFLSGFYRVADGFSLVELVIVVVIVGLSSAIAFPIISSNDTKAKLCEADASLSGIRTQLRIYYSKNGEYPITNEAVHVIGADWNDYATGKLTGKYFKDASYTYSSATGTDFILCCEGGKVLDSDRKLNHSGILSGGS